MKRTIRLCQFPGCKKNISALPEGFSLCTEHQIKYQLLKEAAANWIDGRPLPEEDLLFVFFHPDPLGCCAEHLANHMGLQPSTVSRKVQRATIRGELYLGPRTYTYKIAQEEQVRALDIFRNWQLLFEVAKEWKTRVCELKKHAIPELLGPSLPSLSGYAAVVRSRISENTRIEFLAIRKKKCQAALNGRNPKQAFLRPNERTLASVATKCLADRHVGNNWKERGLIKCFRRGHHWLVTDDEYLAFLQKLALGPKHAKRRLVERCRELLAEEENHELQLQTAV